MYYATKTTNKSFIHMWRTLQSDKVENNIFMLSVNDKDLIDFSFEKYNSFDKSSKEFKDYRKKVLTEAKSNVWFYFRELYTVDDGLGGVKQFELDPVSTKMIYLFEKRRSFILINKDPKYRNVLSYIWDYQRRTSGTDICLIGSRDEFSENLFPKVRNNSTKMPCQVMFNSTAIFDDLSEKNRFIKFTSDDCLSTYGTDNDMYKTIKSAFNKYNGSKSWFSHQAYIFSLDKYGSNSPIYYSYLIKLHNIGNYRFAAISQDFLDTNDSVYGEELKVYQILTDSIMHRAFDQFYDVITLHGIYYII